MDEVKRKLKGSPSRDLFKMLHKQKLPSYCYAFDLDLCLVEKSKKPIVAYLDLKTGNDSPTFSEVLGYVEWIETKLLFFFYAENEKDINEGKFRITQFTGGDYRPNPPISHEKPIIQCDNWNDVSIWEEALRRGHVLTSDSLTPSQLIDKSKKGKS